MDVARLSLAVAIAAAGAPFALAATQPSAATLEHTTYFAGQGDWSSAGPTTAPTISANRDDRYAYPPPTTRTAAPPPSITDRAQNAVSETANAVRDGIDAGVRAVGQQLAPPPGYSGQGLNQQLQSWGDAASQQLQSAGNSIRSAAEQTFGTPAGPSKFSNPFAPPAPAATTTTTTTSRTGVAPPPSWPSAAATSSSLAAPDWNDSAEPLPPDQSFTTAAPTATPSVQPTGAWTSIGSNVAAPPLVVPQPSAPPGGFSTTPNSTTLSSPATSPQSYRDRPSIHSPLVTPSQSTPAPQNNRTTPAADNWPTTGERSSNAPQATIARAPNSAMPSNAGRLPELSSIQPVATTTQGTKTATTPSTANDLWPDDKWNQPAPQPAATTSITTATISKLAEPNSATNPPPPTQPATASPALNPPAIASATSGTHAAASKSTLAPTVAAANVNKPASATTANAAEAQPWLPLVATVLGLAGSLAANLFLGWSYLEARQKYQSLVHRTADTFRRTKAAA